MKNILARGGVEFLAVFLGIGLSLWVDEYKDNKNAEELNYQILNRLYDNLEVDSIDGVWNINAHKTAIYGSNKVSLWCKNNQPRIDSIDIFLSSMAIGTFFLNNMEEYNSLKSSGRMELIKNENLVKSLHEYYTRIEWLESSNEMLERFISEQFSPFMSNYANDFVLDKSKNIYDNSYSVYYIIENPPKDKLNYFAGVVNSYNTFIHSQYKDIVRRVTKIRKMISEELSS